MNTKEEEVKATWKIPRTLLREFKHFAADDDTTVTALVITAMKEFARPEERVPVKNECCLMTMERPSFFFKYPKAEYDHMSLPNLLLNSMIQFIDVDT